MTEENKNQKSLFRKIVIILTSLLLFGLVIGAVSYLVMLKEAFEADNKWHHRGMIGERVIAPQICFAEQRYKLKTGNFTNNFADLDTDFGGKGNIKEFDPIVITLDSPYIYVSDNKTLFEKRFYLDMNDCSYHLYNIKSGNFE